MNAKKDFEGIFTAIFHTITIFKSTAIFSSLYWYSHIKKISICFKCVSFHKTGNGLPLRAWCGQIKPETNHNTSTLHKCNERFSVNNYFNFSLFLTQTIRQLLKTQTRAHDSYGLGLWMRMMILITVWFNYGEEQHEQSSKYLILHSTGRQVIIWHMDFIFGWTILSTQQMLQH